MRHPHVAPKGSSRSGVSYDVRGSEPNRELVVRGVKAGQNSDASNRYRTLSETEQENERHAIQATILDIDSRRKTIHKDNLNRQRCRGTKPALATGDCSTPSHKATYPRGRTAWTYSIEEDEDQEAPPAYMSCNDDSGDDILEYSLSGDEKCLAGAGIRSNIQTKKRVKTAQVSRNNQHTSFQSEAFLNTDQGLNESEDERNFSLDIAADLSDMSFEKRRMEYDGTEIVAPSYDESFHSCFTPSSLYSPSALSEDEGLHSDSFMFRHNDTQTSRRNSNDRRPCSAFALATKHIRSGILRAKSARPISTARVARVVKSYYEQKHMEMEEKLLVEQQAAAKLDRAKRGKPPVNLLERQKHSAARKKALVQENEEKLRQMYQQVKARDVPVSTYRTKCEDEVERRTRIMKRSQEYLLRASLPSRMTQALIVEAKANARKVEKRDLSRQFRSKPVPDFDRLHRQWERSEQEKKVRQKESSGEKSSAVPFFEHRQDEYDALRQKRLARKKRISDGKLEYQQAQLRKYHSLMTKINRECSSTSNDPKLTKTDQLRRDELKKRIIAAKERELETQQAQEVRERRLKLAKVRIKQQVELLESQRRDNYPGTFVDLQQVQQIAKDQAKSSKASFRQALLENRKRIMEAVATQPTLMERFMIDLKKEEHKKQALACVVKNVICANKLQLREILTPEEENIAKS